MSITCAKTGYGATVEFLTKPFYGGKKNRITAEILQPDRKPFVTISGEWNGAMVAKWTDGVCYMPAAMLNFSLFKTKYLTDTTSCLTSKNSN